MFDLQLLHTVQIGVLVALSSFVPLLIAVAITLYWILKFHSSITYILENDKIIATKGVWWKTKSFVPYNRITNVNIYQGPISASFRCKLQVSLERAAAMEKLQRQ